MTTIAEVARRAGVARSTVSKALNGTRPVHPATRARILAAAEELDYRPNATARNLRSRRTHTIALSIPLDIPGRTLGHGPFSQFIECIADRLNNRDFKLLCLISRSPEANELVRLAREGHVDGLLLLQIRLDDARIAALQAQRLPFVAMGRSNQQPEAVWIDTDVGGAAEQAVQHLLEGGYRRIAFLGGRPLFGYEYYALEGFHRAHQRYGLPVRPADVLSSDPAAGVQAALQPFLNRPDGPTALITTTDLEAIEALHFFAAHGLHVPDEVGIVTLGDSLLTQHAKPAITTVFYSVEEFSRRAVDMLIDLIEGKEVPQRQVLLPETLLQRESSRPVRDGPVRAGAETRARAGPTGRSPIATEA